MPQFPTLLFGLLGGILPALLWLWFWLREDEHPEPRKLITYAFIGGMLSIPLVIPLQLYVRETMTDETIVTILLAFLEEALKFVMVLLVVLLRKDDDEPVDPMIYLITSALGFAALENVLYIITPLHNGDFLYGLMTGNLRFIGATLLHIVSSSAIGIALGLTFYRSWVTRVLAALFGLGIATGLHSAFNLFIIATEGKQIFTVFYGVWLGVVLLAFFFEKVKNVKPNHVQFK